MWMRTWPIGLLLIATLAGCLAGPGDDPTEPREAEAQLPVWQDGALHMDITVPVITIGMPAEARLALADALADGEEVVQYYWDNPITWPPDLDMFPDSPQGEYTKMHLIPTARYAVTPLPEAAEARLEEQLDEWSVSGGDLEGRELESFLMEVAEEHGLVFDPNAPSLVLFHGESFRQSYQWRYSMPNGYLPDVAVFGEREPMHIIDTTRSGFDLASDAGRSDLADFVRAATHYRILQAPIYSVPLADCHAITLVTAYRPTALTEINPMMRGALELLDPDAIQGAFENLTGTTVHVDVINLMLPVDDPVLDAMARGEGTTSEQQRWWFMENWDRYWVEHDGCEAYVSWLIHTDTASPSTGLAGLGTYDHSKGYRIALSWVNELFRMLSDPDSPLTDGAEGLDTYNFVNYLHAHEAGHIAGKMHPHHLMRENVESRTDFQDVWSVMSYSSDGRVIDFGVIEQANFQRNRMAFLFEAVHTLELDNTTQYEQALVLASEYRWNEASELLWALVDDGLVRVGGNLRAPDGIGTSILASTIT